MIKWSRVKLALSIVTAAGLWQTLRERIAFAPTTSRCKGRPVEQAAGCAQRSSYDIAGALHVHSTYSDGTGTVDQIADAAVAASIDFVFLTDHSSLAAQINREDGWRKGGRVLIAVGTEIATDTGHLLVTDIPESFDVQAGMARDIMARVRQVGGYGYIALPCDLKDHWRDFRVRDDNFGLEVFNLSAVARTKINVPGFLFALIRYRSRRPISAFNLIAGRPNQELRLWDRLCIEAFDEDRPSPQAIGSVDAHAVMRFGGKDYPYPTYEQVFRTLRTHVMTPSPLSRERENVAADLEMLHSALRSGHSYVSYDNFGDPRGFTFEASQNGLRRTMMGECIVQNGSEPITLDINSPNRRSIIRLIRNGKVVCAVRGPIMRYVAREPGTYRVEVSNYRWRIGSICFGSHPWIFSNPIQVRFASVRTVPVTRSMSANPTQ